MDKIAALRKQIDQLDDLLIDILHDRYNLTNEIGAIKKESHLVVKDNNREEYIFNKISKYSHSPSIELVYKTIINESKNNQRK